MKKKVDKLDFKKVFSSYKKYEKIPKDWELERLDSFMDVNMGQSPKSETYNLQGKGLPFFQGISEFGRVSPTPKNWCSSPIKIAEKDDILISVRAPVGELNISKEKCCIGRGIGSLRPIKADPLYCFYLLKHFKYRFSEFTRVTTYDSINKGGIARVRFPYTDDIDEQKQIGRIINNVEILIKKTDDSNSLYNLLQKGLMQNLFSGKIRVKKTE
jgi:type I restriction enzyme, S subunit